MVYGWPDSINRNPLQVLAGQRWFAVAGAGEDRSGPLQVSFSTPAVFFALDVLRDRTK